MLLAHQFQRLACETCKRPVLNAACKEDPAGLGELCNAVNLDLLTYDPFTGTDLKTILNFVQGDVFNLEYGPRSFPTIVLGEFLEHTQYENGARALTEIHRVLTDDGKLVITYPLDDRPPEAQHGAAELKAAEGLWPDDVSPYHQKVWELPLFEKLINETGFRVITRQQLRYCFVQRDVQGYGFILEKDIGMSEESRRQAAEERDKKIAAQKKKEAASIASAAVRASVEDPTEEEILDEAEELIEEASKEKELTPEEEALEALPDEALDKIFQDHNITFDGRWGRTKKIEVLIEAGISA